MLTVTADTTGIGQGMDYLQETLKSLRLKPKAVNRILLAAEESLVKLSSHTDAGALLQIAVIRRLGTISIRLSSSGESFDLAENSSFGIPLEIEDVDYDTEMAIRNLVLRSFQDNLKYKHKNHRNTIVITAKKSEKKALWMTLGALVLAIALGFLLKFAFPEFLTQGMDTYCFTPVKTMFLNALKMVVGPVVFFSIVSCISNFSNLAEFGKIGAKVMGMYLFTTFIAIGVGLGIFFLFQPGSPSMLDSAQAAAASVETTSVSMLDTVINIVPDNFVLPFLNADMLQIIFIALLCGIAVGMIGDYSKPLKDFFEACNTLFLKITTLIIKFVPLAVFCSVISLILQTGTDTLLSLLGLMGTVIAGMACMIAVYCLLILVIARVNPLIFLRKYAPAMLTTFSLSSSSAAMPVNMQTCRDQLGISSKVCSFSIPLGATVNMDGSCIYLAVAALFLAKIYGVSLSGSEMFSLVFSILILSIGAPGVPGSAFICLSVLLVQIGVPVEAVGLLMGIDPILSMFRATSNTSGDAAVSLAVAKTEGLLDLNVYNR